MELGLKSRQPGPRVPSPKHKAQHSVSSREVFNRIKCNQEVRYDKGCKASTGFSNKEVTRSPEQESQKPDSTRLASKPEVRKETRGANLSLKKFGSEEESQNQTGDAREAVFSSLLLHFRNESNLNV